jgi:hypothetical protein
MSDLVKIGQYEYTAELRQMNGGPQAIFHFDNGYGASVVQNQMSYGRDQGLWELAVLEFDAAGEWELCYDTEITDDVIGFQTPEEIDKWLKRIQAL